MASIASRGAPMKRFWSHRWIRRALAGMTLVTLIALLACWHWRVWSHSDYRAFQEVSRYPVGKDLWFGRIKPGQDVDVLIENIPPHRIRRFGQFVWLTYYAGGPPPPGSFTMESLGVIAKDGRLVSAGAAGCTWNRVFFEMTSEDEAAFEISYRRYREERHKAVTPDQKPG